MDHAVNILQPDVMWMGGLTEPLRVAAMAAGYDVPVVPHGLGACSYHVFVSRPHTPFCEHVNTSSSGDATLPVSGTLLDGDDVPVEGCFHVPNRPGFGLTLAPRRGGAQPAVPGLTIDDKGETVMLDRRTFIAATSLAAMAAGLPRPGAAATFHGFNPEHVGPGLPSTASLKAMVEAARARTPPRNGERYVFGYTMWGGSSPFSQLNRHGLEDLGEAAGIKILTADNEWDPSKNVANAQSFAARNVDVVINSLLDVQFGAAVKRPLDEAGIPIISLDIPIQGSQWVGVSNARAGFRAGTYLAEAAKARWPEAVRDATLIIAAFPLVGPNGKLRNLSQEHGARSVLSDLRAERVIWLDMQGTADSGYQTMADLLGRLPADKPILVASFSDEQLAGALRAATVAGRAEQVLAVGMGGERLDALAADPSFIATVSFFPRRYANAAIPTALALLAGVPMPKSVFAWSDLVTPAAVCRVDPAAPCRKPPFWQPAKEVIDEAAYKAYVASLYERTDFNDFRALLPAIPA